MHAVASGLIGAGLAFGVAVFFTMNYVVVPLSALHTVPQFTTRGFALNMFAMLVFGTIVAWFARRAALITVRARRLRAVQTARGPATGH
jgi:hypothetical protein